MLDFSFHHDIFSVRHIRMAYAVRDLPALRLVPGSGPSARGPSVDWPFRRLAALRALNPEQTLECEAATATWTKPGTQ